LIKPADFRDILAIRRTEFVWAIAALLGVVLLGTLQGILVAIVISLLVLGYQSAHPPVYPLYRKPGTNVFRARSPEHPEDESFPGLLIIHLEGRIFFLNAERIAEQIRPLIEAAHPRVVVFDLSGVVDFEYSALKMLTDAEERQRKAGLDVWLAGLSRDVYAIVHRSPLGATLGRERMFFNLELAVDAYQSTGDRSARPDVKAAHPDAHEGGSYGRIHD
jgi:MFS superfamily sulfate permease-like transporter